VKILRFPIGTILLLLVLSPLCTAQNVPGSRKDDVVLGTNGPVPNPTVLVCLNTATGIPCSPLAQIYSDPLLTQPLTNPMTGDSYGNYYFYVAPGRYQIQISGTGIIGTAVFPYVTIPNDPLNPIFNSAAVLSTISFTNLPATPSTNPPLGGVFLYTKNDKNIYILNDAGVETNLSSGGGGGGGGGSVNSVGLSGPGGIFVVSGSPVTSSGNINLSVAGSILGIPYFSGPSTLSSSVSLTANYLIKMGASAPLSSSVFDDSINPTQTPNGDTVVRNGLFKQMPNAGSGTTTNYLVCENASGQAATCPVSTVSGVTGVAGQGAGTTGNVQVCIVGRCSVIFDNQSAILDWAIPSTSVAGELHDTGSTSITPGVENFLVDSINSGAATVAQVDLGSPDAIFGSLGLTGTGTANALPKFVSANQIGNSLWTDNGTTSTYFGLGGISIPMATFTGGGPFAIVGQEGPLGSCPSIASGFDILCWNSSSHALFLSNGLGTYLQVAQLPVPSSGLTTSNRYRTCQMVVGTDDGSALINTNLGPQGRRCFIPAAATVVEVTVAADAGTPNAVPAKNHAGTITDFVSAPLATAASGGLACSNIGGTLGLDGATTCTNTLTTTAIVAGDWIQLDSGATAGGTAKRMSISVTYSVN
jgi:hypothetical protein